MADFDPTIPSIARVYDYFLGGKDNFAADRELGKRLASLIPSTPVSLRENKEFLGQAVTWGASQGISQFVDLGCGMPTSPSTHEAAQAALPGARVVYVDDDPIVVCHLNARAAAPCPGVTVVDGDIRQVAATVRAVADGVDLAEPACLIMGSLLHFFAARQARELVAQYAGALAPGSYLIVTMGVATGEAAEQFIRMYSKGPSRLYLHTPEDFAGFLGPLELMPPGIGDVRGWRHGASEVAAVPPRESWMIAGIARVG